MLTASKAPRAVCDGGKRQMQPALWSTGLHPEGIDQSRKRRRLLSPARIIKKESRERLAPVLQHAYELAAREMMRNLILPHESEAYAVNGGADNDLHVINDQRPVDSNG